MSSSASVTSLAMAASLAPKALTLCNPKPPLLSLPSLSSSSLKLQTNLICLTSKGFKSLSSRFVRNVAISSQLEQDEGDFQLFVDNLPFSVDSDQLTELFERAGNIESAEVIYDKASGRSRGSGYVTLSSIDEVEAAAKQFNGYELDGRKLRVSSGSPLARGGRRGGGVGGSESGNQKEVYAIGRYISMSADKARRVIDQIRGRSYAESLMILELMPYRACYPILKLVYSAAANGNHNMGFNEASLIISKAEVNEGKTVKKLRPQARGRGYAVRRRTCHITIGVKDLEAAV